MRSFSVICCVALCALALVGTGGQADEQVDSYANSLFDELPEESYHAAVENLRLKRATCDLLSAFGVGDTACAAHCITKKYKGGYCSAKKVCTCRK